MMRIVLPTSRTLPGTSKYARSNMSRALAPAPRKKKPRPLDPRLSGKENWDSHRGNKPPMVDDLEGPIRAGKNQFRGPMVIPRKNDMAGENAPATLAASCLDSDTLLGSHVRFPILTGMNPFRGPREIPRFLNGIFVGRFLSQVQIPADHPR